MTETIQKNAVLVGIVERSAELSGCERSLDELESLLNTAGAHSVAKVIQVKDTWDPRTCIGSGKVEEIAELCKNMDASLVVFDVELSPAQIRNLEDEIECADVIDRSMLILDIFALHAKSGEGKLQVELAQLKYSAPRLIGHGTELSRQGGGIGSRGPGESKLETDKRHLKERIRALEAQLDEMEHNRAVMRRARDRSGMVKVGIVGYTNVGKSTLLNRLTDAGVLSEDKLFATLDPTTRRLTLPSGEEILLTDTVGFIRKLPHHLIEAFKSTLDEVRYADVLLVVADATDPCGAEHLAVTEQIIEQLGAADRPILYVYNKCDLPDPSFGCSDAANVVAISARTGEGVDRMLDMLDDIVSRRRKACELVIPYDKQGILNALYADAVVTDTDYREDGVHVKAKLDLKAGGRYSEYIK